MKKRVVITGYSVINDMGKNRQQVEEGIFSGLSGVSMQDFEFGDGVTTGPYGVVSELNEVDPFFEKEGIPYDRCSQLALMAAADCVRESGLDVEKEDPFRLRLQRERSRSSYLRIQWRLGHAGGTCQDTPAPA